MQKEKLQLIEWLHTVEDDRIIDQFLVLQRSNQILDNQPLTDSQKAAIDQGLEAIQKGHVMTHDKAMKTVKENFPHLFN